MVYFKYNKKDEGALAIPELVRIRQKACSTKSLLVDYYSTLLNIGRELDSGEKAIYDHFGDIKVFKGLEKLEVLGAENCSERQLDLLLSHLSALSLLTSDEEWLAVLGRASKLLKPGGRFIFDLEPLRREACSWQGVVRVVGSTHDHCIGEIVVSEVLTLLGDDVLKVRLALEEVGAGGGVKKKGYKNLLLGLLDEERMGRLAGSSGFAVEEHISRLGGGDEVKNPELSIWVLRKKRGVAVGQEVPGGVDT